MYTIYIKRNCFHSNTAVRAAKATGEKCVVIDIEKYKSSIDQVVAKLKKHGFMHESVRHTTVPIVFIDGKYIGGNRELQQKLSA